MHGTAAKHFAVAGTEVRAVAGNQGIAAQTRRSGKHGLVLLR
jgi:hypothetical protein